MSESYGDRMRMALASRRIVPFVGVYDVFSACGNSPRCDLSELASIGVSVVIYSTPCLFAAQAAIEGAMQELRERNGLLRSIDEGGVGVSSCTAILEDNLRSSRRTWRRAASLSCSS